MFTGVFFSYLKILNFCMLLMHFQGEEEEGGGRRKKKEKEEINLKTAGGQKTQQSQPHLHKQAITEKQQLKSRKE